MTKNNIPKDIHKGRNYVTRFTISPCMVVEKGVTSGEAFIYFVF